MSADRFFLLSMERTTDAATCVWWRPNASGYTSSIGEAGRYSREDALKHSDPPYHLAIPCGVVEIPSMRAKALSKHALRKGGS